MLRRRRKRNKDANQINQSGATKALNTSLSLSNFSKTSLSWPNKTSLVHRLTAQANVCGCKKACSREMSTKLQFTDCIEVGNNFAREEEDESDIRCLDRACKLCRPDQVIQKHKVDTKAELKGSKLRESASRFWFDLFQSLICQALLNASMCAR